MEETNYEVLLRIVEKYGDPSKPLRFQNFKELARKQMIANRSKGYDVPDGQVTRDQAIRADAISAGGLSIIKNNPFFYELRSMNSYSKPVFTKGKLIHTAVLEPEKMDQEYISEFTSTLDPRSTEYQTAKAQYADVAKGKTVVKLAEWQNAEAISCVVNTFYFPAMSGTVREPCYLWTDDNGIRHKAMPDFYDPRTKTIWDLKTVGGSLGEFDLRKSITNYGTSMQLAHYSRVMNKLGYEVNHHRLLFVQSVDGHEVADYEVPQAIIETNKMEIETIAESLYFFRENPKIRYGEKEIWPFGYEIDGSMKS